MHTIFLLNLPEFLNIEDTYQQYHKSNMLPFKPRYRDSLSSQVYKRSMLFQLAGLVSFSFDSGFSSFSFGGFYCFFSMLLLLRFWCLEYLWFVGRFLWTFQTNFHGLFLKPSPRGKVAMVPHWNRKLVASLFLSNTKSLESKGFRRGMIVGLMTSALIYSWICLIFNLFIFNMMMGFM